MRINKFIAGASGVSRRGADQLIHSGRVTVNGVSSGLGQEVTEQDDVRLDGRRLQLKLTHQTVLLNKPAGYVCSRHGQGSRTIYDLLPANLHQLNPVGRLDKDSSGLILLTDDGQLAYELTHPKFQKQKVYDVRLDHDLAPLHQQMISDHGVQLEDGPSSLILSRLSDVNRTAWQVTMSEGRNRQIRRTFASLGYEVVELNRRQFGNYTIDDIRPGDYRLA